MNEGCPRTPDFCLGSKGRQKLWVRCGLTDHNQTNISFTGSVPKLRVLQDPRVSWPFHAAQLGPVIPDGIWGRPEWQVTAGTHRAGAAHHPRATSGKSSDVPLGVEGLVPRRGFRLFSAEAAGGWGSSGQAECPQPTVPPHTHQSHGVSSTKVHTRLSHKTSWIWTQVLMLKDISETPRPTVKPECKIHQ